MPDSRNLQNKPSAPSQGPPALPDLTEAFRVWLKIGLLSFGGPAGQIAMMHRIVVEERKWIDEPRFMHALNYCMLLPGPEAQQLATYIGWLLHRTAGGLVAGLLFILPGAFVMLGLSIAYVLYADMPLVDAAFNGIKSAVLVIVAEAVVRIARRALYDTVMLMISAGAFIAIFVFSVPFPAIVAVAALLGFFHRPLRPHAALRAGDRADNTGNTTSVLDQMAASGLLDHTRPSVRRAGRLILIFALLWLAPVATLSAVFGPQHVFAQQAAFFSTLAVVTFGGAYAVLAYMAQQAVDVFGWVTPREMIDGLGLAETTPGPLILVTQFVGFLGAHRHADGLAPLWSGVIGCIITLWVTFTPCFLWIFLGAPYVEQLRNNRRITAALSGITAAVVGVVLNLAIWFGLHVSFSELLAVDLPGISLLLPVLASANPTSIALTMLAAALLIMLRCGVLRTLCACAAAGMILSLF